MAVGYWENNGQIVDSIGRNTDVEFYSEGTYPRVYLRNKSKVSFVVSQPDTNVATVDTTYRFDMWPYGVDAQEVTPVGLDTKDWHQNMYMAHGGANGVVGVDGHARVVYEEIYHHIDMHYYSGSKGGKVAFALKPGCDPSQLKLAFAGQDSMKIDLLGNLKVYYRGRWMLMPFAQAYQVDGSGNIVTVNWTPSYQVNNGIGVVSFTWSSYNNGWPLVFQIGLPPFGPASFDEDGLCWGTYLGGGEQDHVYESMEDEHGDYYIVGTTGSSFMSFPPAAGINYSDGGRVAYMMRFNGTDDIEWKTFFGGNALGETTLGTAIGNKEDAQVYMAGHSDSEDLAVYQSPTGSEFYQGSATGPDYKGFVVRLKKFDGTLEWATYYGQNDVRINGMVGVGGKKIFIVGSTTSTIPDLDVAPPTGSTYWDFSSETDGFVSLFGDNDQHAWRTHLTGTANDPAYDVDALGSRVVVMGNTHSPDMHVEDFGTNSYASGPLGSEDCYLYEFNEYGALQWGTYVGSPGFDRSFHNGLALDPVTGDIALVGLGGDDLDPVEGPGWYQDSHPNQALPGFIARFSGSDRTRIWHTYLHNGGSSVTEPATCAFDPFGKLLVAGYSRDGVGVLTQELAGLYQQSTYNADVSGASVEEKDPFIVAFGVNNELWYGSYFGGEANPAYPEWIYTLLHRQVNGNIYFGGATSRANNTASYFPFDDGGGVPYFEADWHGGVTEGFLAAICAEALNEVGLFEVNGTDRTPLTAHWSNEQVSVFGMPIGTHQLDVLDAAGRLVFSKTSGSDGVRLTVELPALAEGTYSVRAAAFVARFTVIR